MKAVILFQVDDASGRKLPFAHLHKLRLPKFILQG